MEDHEVIVSLVIVRPDFSSIRLSPSFDVSLHGSLSIPIASFVERGLFIKTFCHRKYLNRRIVYNIQSGGYYEQRSAHGTMQHKYERRDFTYHATSNAKKRSL